MARLKCTNSQSLRKIAEEIKDAQSVVLVDYRGLTVAQDTELRKQLRRSGCDLQSLQNNDEESFQGY